jgi:hypothetical protein
VPGLRGVLSESGRERRAQVFSNPKSASNRNRKISPVEKLLDHQSAVTACREKEQKNEIGSAFGSNRRGSTYHRRATSRTRQSVRTKLDDSRNSSAEENGRPSNPNDLRSSGKDSRTDSSSSTAETRACITFMLSFFFPLQLTAVCADARIIRVRHHSLAPIPFHRESKNRALLIANPDR